MFERFTDRARRIIVLAQEEARMLRHNQLGTEHVLLGMLLEGEGLAAQALGSAGITLEAVRGQVLEIVGWGEEDPSGYIPFTPRAKTVVELTLRESLQLGHNYIGTEHLLLALLRHGEGEGIAAQVLINLGADFGELRRHTLEMLSSNARPAPSGPVPRVSPVPPTEELVPPPPVLNYEPFAYERFTDQARRVLAMAEEEARSLNHNSVGTEHHLLGMIRESEGVAGQALEALGISLETVRHEVEEILGRGLQPPGGRLPFTPRARRVQELALREALRLGHTYIGTEHLLLGLVREGEGVGCQILVKLGADLNRVRQQVLYILRPGVPPAATSASSLGFERYNDRSRRAVVLAQENARLLRHSHIGTEHLVLGLIHEGEGLAASVLESFGLSLDALRRRVEDIAGVGEQSPAGHVPFTPRARTVLGFAQQEAMQFGDNYVATEHILLGIVREGEGVGAQALVSLGGDLGGIRSRLLGLMSTRRRREPATAAARGTFERFTDRARRIVVLAQEEARTLYHNYVGPEHLLLGLIHDGEGVAIAVIEGMGIAPEDLRREVEEIIGQGGRAPSGYIPFTPRAKKVLDLAWQEAQNLGHSYVGAEHLLLGMLREGEGVPGVVLLRRGAELPPTRVAVLRSLGVVPPGATVESGQPAGNADPTSSLASSLASSVEEWARWQAASIVRNGGPSVELYHGASGLVLLGRSGLHLPLGFVADVLRLTRAGSQPEERLAALHSMPDVQRLRALGWPPPARVGFAALLGAGAPADPRWVPPAAAPAELRSSLMRAVNRSRPDEAPPEVTAEILNAGRRLSEGVLTTLLVVGPGAVAADPALPLRLRHGADALPALSGPQQALLEWTGARAVVPARSRSASTAPGPGLTGISRRGQLTNLLPSQLVLPPAILRHRFADRALLYRLHETETQPPVETVRILLDTSPPTFGSIGVALRIVVQAIVSALWQARQVPTLVYLDQPDLETAVHKPSDLGAAWTHQSLEPVDLGPVLVAAQRSEQPSVLLTQHRLVADHGIVATEQLRVITAQLPGDDPDVAADPPFHAHLAAEPTKAQLADAVRTALAPKER
ncbi:Clp protease N-terminal domain-containing protein [Paractinoplanes globisporus]|uniref:Clp protease N-terminal domain-containing protein n=1 Tax=Paractinoplanes globisporus TaxID=113565 RepID=A0ABW6WBT0_9ACTN|nr:Clp protease N-terminal domain-containing protein [Actinoplanes globisporus]